MKVANYEFKFWEWLWTIFIVGNAVKYVFHLVRLIILSAIVVVSKHIYSKKPDKSKNEYIWDIIFEIKHISVIYNWVNLIFIQFQFKRAIFIN